jgi:hypothetical protein
MKDKSMYTFKQMCFTGTFLGMAYGLIIAVTVHQPMWLDQPDYMTRCAILTAAAFALIGLSLVPYIGEGAP